MRYDVFERKNNYNRCNTILPIGELPYRVVKYDIWNNTVIVKLEGSRFHYRKLNLRYLVYSILYAKNYVTNPETLRYYLNLGLI
jgi:hypothetical protein